LQEPALTEEAVELLVNRHSWPGNIRELENVIHHALLVCRENLVRPEDLRLSSLNSRTLSMRSSAAPSDPERELKNVLFSLFEKEQPNLYATIEAAVMKAAYEFCDRNQLQTARLLGISRNIVRARLLQCGVLGGANAPLETPIPGFPEPSATESPA